MKRFENKIKSLLTLNSSRAKHSVQRHLVLAALAAWPSPLDFSTGDRTNLVDSLSVFSLVALNSATKKRDYRSPACREVSETNKNGNSVRMEVERSGTYVGSITLKSVLRRWKQIGQAWATTAGHCCNTRCRSRNPKRHIDHGSHVLVLDVCAKFITDVDVFAESVEQKFT